MANIAISGMAVTYRALLFSVTRASTCLSKHGVGCSATLSDWMAQLRRVWTIGGCGFAAFTAMENRIFLPVGYRG